MKFYVFIAALFCFTATLSAQSLPSTKSVKKVTNEIKAKEAPSKNDLIKKALAKDEGLQLAALDHLKSNPKTSTAVASIAKNNTGSLAGMMKSVMGNKQLTNVAIDYIANNPKLLEKAMKIVGM